MNREFIKEIIDRLPEDEKACLDYIVHREYQLKIKVSEMYAEELNKDDIIMIWSDDLAVLKAIKGHIENEIDRIPSNKDEHDACLEICQKDKYGYYGKHTLTRVGYWRRPGYDVKFERCKNGMFYF